MDFKAEARSQGWLLYEATSCSGLNRLDNLLLGPTAWAGSDIAKPPATKRLVQRGVTVIAASGNQGSDNGMSAPACIRDVISVAASYDGDLGRMPEQGEFGGSGCFDHLVPAEGAVHIPACAAQKILPNVQTNPGACRRMAQHIEPRLDDLGTDPVSGKRQDCEMSRHRTRPLICSRTQLCKTP